MRIRLVGRGVWSRPTRGVFDVEPQRDRRRDADHRRRRTAWLGMLAYGPDAVAVGACALALHGAGGLPLDIAAEVALPEGIFGRGRDGMRVRQLTGVESTRFGDRRIATLSYALLTALPDLGRNCAAAVLDDLLHRGLRTATDIDHLAGRLAGRRGCTDAIGWLNLLDRRSESPLESHARLDCVDAGVPPDELQVVIRSPGGAFLGRGDLGWRLPDGRWLIAEIDGREFHERPEALLRDRARQNALLLQGGIDLLRFTSEDIDQRIVGSTIADALRSVREQHGTRLSAG